MRTTRNFSVMRTIMENLPHVSITELGPRPWERPIPTVSIPMVSLHHPRGHQALLLQLRPLLQHPLLLLLPL